MQFSTKIDGFEQKDSQGFENSYNSYEQYPLEKFLIFTIYQNYTLALREVIMQSCVCRPLWMELCQKYVISYEDNSPLTLYIDFQIILIFLGY